MINERLITLRKTVRSTGRHVVDTLINDHSANICVICGSTHGLTKEHVIPKWVFENDPNKYFVTDINGIRQYYSKTAVPACSECNSEILGTLECYLENLFRDTHLDNDYFGDDDLEKIVLWLELIDYKFQALNLRRKFKKPMHGEYIPYLSEIPISILQNISVSPHKVFSNLRTALKRLGFKSKAGRINSLVVFRTTNLSFHFFHKMNTLIFVELPKHQIALFYFINQDFRSAKQAHAAAMKIIGKAY